MFGTLLAWIACSSASGVAGVDGPVPLQLHERTLFSLTEVEEAAANFGLVVASREGVRLLAVKPRELETAWGLSLAEAGTLAHVNAVPTADVDGDGTDEVLVGIVPFVRTGSASSVDESTRTGRALLVSGRDGRELAVLESEDPAALFGLSVARAWDLNQDGYRDVAVGAPAAGELHFLSGHPDDLLRELRVVRGQDHGVERPRHFGARLAWLEDGGRGVLMVGAPVCSSRRGGSVLVLGGPPIAALRDIPLDYPHCLDAPLGGAGDLDGDGAADFWVGCADFGATIYCGATGSSLVSLASGSSDSGQGSSLASLGDVDGDGTPDYVLGGKHMFAGKVRNTGGVALFSGRTGNVLWKQEHPEDGADCIAIHDANGDGVRDVVVHRIERASLEVWSGRDATCLALREVADLL